MDALKDYSVTSVAYDKFSEFMSSYGDNFRTFKHVAFHGILTGVMFIFPIFATNGMFERKPFKFTLN